MSELNEGSRYLEETFSEDEYFRLVHKIKPLKHRLLLGGPLGLATHDVACFVCFDGSATYSDGMFHPCRKCQEKGYKIVKQEKSLLKSLFRWGFKDESRR